MFSTLAKRLRENAIWPWFFRLTQALSLVLLLYWWRHLPLPGYAIGVLGVLAAAMSLHIEARMKWWDKAVWLLLIGGFLVLEFNAIGFDRTQQEKAHQAELQAQAKIDQDTMAAILDSRNAQMAQNQKQFDKTLEQMKGLATSSKQTFEDVGRALAPLDDLRVEIFFKVDCDRSKYTLYCRAAIENFRANLANENSVRRPVINNWSNFSDVAQTTLDLQLDIFANAKDSDSFLAAPVTGGGSLSLEMIENLAHSESIMSYPMNQSLVLLIVNHSKPFRIVSDGTAVRGVGDISGKWATLTEGAGELGFLRPTLVKLTNKNGQSVESKGPFDVVTRKGAARDTVAFRFVFPPRKQ
jgi:hypothetical protein